MKSLKVPAMVLLAVLAVTVLPSLTGCKSTPTLPSQEMATLTAPAIETPTSTIDQAGKCYVMISMTTKLYHRQGCRLAGRGAKRVTLQWAKQHGYAPCGVCKPPRSCR